VTKPAIWKKTNLFLSAREVAETQVWIDYGRDCAYWSKEVAQELSAGYEEVGRMLGGMIAHPEKFAL
jgi:four helix bundle protein